MNTIIFIGVSKDHFIACLSDELLYDLLDLSIEKEHYELSELYQKEINRRINIHKKLPLPNEIILL